MIPPALTLKGKSVILRPLEHKDAAPLFTVSQDEALWRYMPVPCPRTADDTAAWIHAAREARDAGTAVPFAIVETDGMKPVGSTRFLDIQPEHRSLEIGWTWITPAFQRTGINTEMKRLMLAYAFEEWSAVRVQLKGDMRNLKSRTAIERLGATFEGTLRKQRICHDGHIRDTFYYSILDTEWPILRKRIDTLLARDRYGRNPPGFSADQTE